MGMKLMWMAKATTINDLKKGNTDITFMRKCFLDFLKGKGKTDANLGNILVSAQKNFYTAKKNSVLESKKGQKVYLGHFKAQGEGQDRKLVLYEWGEAPDVSKLFKNPTIISGDRKKFSITKKAQKDDKGSVEWKTIE